MASAAPSSEKAAWENETQSGVAMPDSRRSSFVATLSVERRQADTLAEHRARDIALEGYSALRGGTLEHPAVLEIAERTGRTPAQVIIRWHLQHEVIVIPKSVNTDRIRSNADVAGFSLTDEDMATLDALGSR